MHRLEPCNMKAISGAPLGLRLARKMSRSRFPRGAGALTRLLGRLGRLDRIAQYELGPVKFGVPLSRIPWDFADVANYEAELVASFSLALAPLGNVTLFDCGADIGTFSALVCSRTDRIAQILAFEPNSSTQPFLKFNLDNLGIPYHMVPKAVSNFSGYGHRERPPENVTDHARYLVPGEGLLEVTTIDSMNVRGGDIAMKLDIEVGE